MSMQVKFRELDRGEEEDSGGSWLCHGLEMVGLLIGYGRCWTQKECVFRWYDKGIRRRMCVKMTI